ncbi:MAG TPA: arginase family protein, partial [Nitrososphaeraceae archaeon]|nr:arginase family protein [Nitrososphaeraceae archaeon]
LEDIQSFFVSPELGDAGVSFADFPTNVSLIESNVIVYGVPLDLTTSFGKGTREGPNSIRLTSAKQIETYLFEENTDLTDRVKVYDLGDMNMPTLNSNFTVGSIISSVGSNIILIADHIKSSGKIPILLGGEHTVSYYQIKALADANPLILHFDAHRDMKPQYDGMIMCHTTPFYHLINDGHILGQDLVQIGIRQCDREENQIALNKGVTTFDAWTIHDDIDKLLLYLNKVTSNRIVYISFDIDVYDLSYVPCTGCPEPYGLDPFQVAKIIKSISSSALLIGMDMVEVAARNGDYREGTLAVQTLYRVLVNLQRAYS